MSNDRVVNHEMLLMCNQKPGYRSPNLQWKFPLPEPFNDMNFGRAKIPASSTD